MGWLLSPALVGEMFVSQALPPNPLLKDSQHLMNVTGEPNKLFRKRNGT